MPILTFQKHKNTINKQGTSKTKLFPQNGLSKGFPASTFTPTPLGYSIAFVCQSLAFRVHAPPQF
jgi:hypothetical protein